jgi:large subunit ribosomal protein L21
MFAVIETGSKQYRVEVGTELAVELLDAEPGETITLERVLLIADGETASVGRPLVPGATVSAEVIRQDRGEKVISFKYRPKARRRVKKGHRQELTVLRVADIVFGGKSAAETVRKAEAAAKTERQRLEEAAARQAAEDAALAATLAKAAEAKAEKAAEAAAGKTPAARSKPAKQADDATAMTAAPKRSRARATPGADEATPSPDAPKRGSRTKKDE